MKQILTVFVCATLCMSLCVPAFAADSPAHTKIVYLLDASNSMNSNDPQRLAVDAIKQMALSAPSNADLGFVAFNDGVTASVPLGGVSDREKLTQVVDETVYIGYTDAGSALEKAVGMFTSSEESPQYIIILSDGEIALEDPDDTARSLRKFKESTADAKKKDISVFTVRLGDELSDAEHPIFTAAKESGGKIYFAPTADELQSAVNSRIWADIGFHKQAAASITATGENDEITVNIPAIGADVLRVILTGQTPVQDISVTCEADEVKVHSGVRYNIVELKKPRGSAFDLHFIGTKGDRVSAETVAECSATISAEVAYPDEQQERDAPRKANVSLRLLDPQNSEINLLALPGLEGKQAIVSVNGENRNVAVKDGALTIERDLPRDEQLAFEVLMPDAGINLIAENNLTVVLDSTKPGWTTAEKIAVGAGIAVLLAAVVAALLMRRRQKPYRCDVHHNYGFYGKLDVYVVWARGGDYEIPPFTFQLNQLAVQKKISLAQLLSASNVQLEFEGAERIWFFAGPERTLLVKNSSKAALYYAGSTVSAGESLQLCFGQKVYISFEEDKDEIEIYYRNVKEQMPVGISERRDYSIHA